MSEEPADGYFADGLTEEILNRLVGTKGLRVAGRTSSFVYKDRPADLRGIARELGVDLVLEGSVRRAGDQLRITAQLIDGRDGIHLWSRTYNQRMADIFEVQDTVAADVAGQLALDLAPTKPHQAVTTRDPQAMALYLQAKAARGEYTAERISLALTWTLEALRLDPAFAEAHALLAMIELDQVYGGVVAEDRAIPRARKAIDRALELAPDSPSVLTDAGRVLVWEAGIGGGLESIDRARQLNARALAIRPDDTDVLQRQVWLLTRSGDFEAARPLLDRLASTQELNPLHRELVTGFLIQFGRREEARALIDLLPEHYPSRYAFTAFAAEPDASIEQSHAAFCECVRRGQSSCYFDLAARFFLLGDDAHAIEALEAVPEAHAANREQARTWAMQMRGEWEAAREFTLQRFPELLDAASGWLVVLADQAVAQGDWTRALQLWQRIEPGLFHDPPRTRMTANSSINVAYTLWQVENEPGARRIWQMLDAHFDAEPTFVHNARRTLNAVLAAHALGHREKARDRLQAAIDAGFRAERLFEYTIDKTPFPAGEAARNDPLLAPLLAALRERNRADRERLHAYLAAKGLPAVPVWNEPSPAPIDDGKRSGG